MMNPCVMSVTFYILMTFRDRLIANVHGNFYFDFLKMLKQIFREEENMKTKNREI